MGTTCDECDVNITTSDYIDGRRSVTFSNWQEKVSGKVILCPECLSKVAGALKKAKPHFKPWQDKGY